MLYEAAQSMLRSKKWSWLKASAMQIARRRGMKKAIVALARRLAVIIGIDIWVDGTEFCWTRESRGGMRIVQDQGLYKEETRAPPRGGMMSLAGRWMR